MKTKKKQKIIIVVSSTIVLIVSMFIFFVIERKINDFEEQIAQLKIENKKIKENRTSLDKHSLPKKESRLIITDK